LMSDGFRIVPCLSPECNLSEMFTGYGHYADEVENIMMGILAVVS